MKILLSILLLLSTRAMASLPNELVGSGNCDSMTIDPLTESKFIVSDDPKDPRVKMVFQLVQDYEGDPVHQDFETTIIKSIHRDGTQILTADGIVCANYKKVGIFGYKTWVDTFHCTFVAKDLTEVQTDPDGLGHHEVCTRDFFFHER